MKTIIKNGKVTRIIKLYPCPFCPAVCYSTREIKKHLETCKREYPK